jgi:hypothetical protein
MKKRTPIKMLSMWIVAMALSLWCGDNIVGCGPESPLGEDGNTDQMLPNPCVDDGTSIWYIVDSWTQEDAWLYCCWSDDTILFVDAETGIQSAICTWNCIEYNDEQDRYVSLNFAFEDDKWHLIAEKTGPGDCE